MSKLRLPPGKHFQSVVEWRYDKAHRYWDDCGKLIAQIEAAFPGLKCEGLQNDAGFKFSGKSRGITGATFYWEKATLAQVGIGDAGVSNATSTFWEVVSTMLGASVNWMGHRTWVVFPLESPRQAVHWLESFSLWEFASGGVGRLGSPRTGGSVLRTNLDAGRKLRLETNAGTVQAEDVKHHGVIVDADIVVEDKEHLPPDMATFIDENLRFLRESVEPLYRAK